MKSTPQLPAAICLAMLMVSGPGLAEEGEDAAEPTFDVWEFAVSGNSVLPQQAVEKSVYPFLGPDRRVADVEKARLALETAYRDAGFGTVAVNIPEQDVQQGLVRLEVVEGTVDRLLVSGTRYFSPEQIRQAVPSLAAGRVPDLPQVQKELGAVNAATSDRQVTPVLRAGRSPGTLEAELKVADSLPVHGSLEVNDQYTRDTTRTRVAATLSYDNLWQRQHSALVGVQTAPEDTDDVTVLFGTYTARLGDSPWILSGYLVDSDTDVASIGTLGVIGKGSIAGLRFIRPLPILAGGFPRITLGLDHKDFEESIALTGNQPTIETPIEYGVLSAGWGITFPGEGSATTLNLLGVMGPRFLGNDAVEFESKRAGAKADFFHFNLALDHERELVDDVRLRFGLTGQLAGSPMISNEQFGFGGASTVRGYLESEQFVDNGYATQLELISPDWGRRLTEDLQGRLLAFVDAGGGNLQDALPEQDDHFFLWSTGIGLRLAVWRRLTADLDWAYPLKDNSDGSIDAGDSRWHFSTKYTF